MEVLEKDIKTDFGDPVYSYEYIEALRVSDRKKANPLKIIAQRGCQEKFLASSSDITIFGGSRGGSKSFSLLMESLKDIYNPYYNSILLRNEKDDLLDLINTSYILYGQMGQYNKSISD